MGEETRVLKFIWMYTEVLIKVEVDKCNLLDLVVEFEDEAKKQGKKLDYHYPSFSYVYKMDHSNLITDKDLLRMFERISSEVIIIWVGTTMKPDNLYKLMLNFRRMDEKGKKLCDDLPSLEDLENTSIVHGTKNNIEKVLL